MLLYIPHLSDRQENWGPSGSTDLWKPIWLAVGNERSQLQLLLMIYFTDDLLLVFAEEFNKLSKMPQNRVRASP